MNTKNGTFENFIESIKFNSIEEVKSKFKIQYFTIYDEYGLKPIHWACLSSNLEILEWMLEKKCNIETLSKNGWRPIHLAAFIGDLKIVQFLIENYCKLNCKTYNGETVLDVANGNCNHEFIDEILNENINWKIGLSMGLKCDIYCNHKFCLRSVVQCEFDKNEQIGLGRFGIIYKVTESENNQQFAVKIVNKHKLFKNPNCLLLNINQFLPHLNHSKIVKLFGMIESKIDFILFMELMSNGSLYDKIRNFGSLMEDKINRYCKDILEAVAFLHNRKILHRYIDLKNILLDNNNGCKLIISSFSCYLADLYDEDNKDFSYYSFVAPEILKKESLSYSYDIWWLGCTVIDMWTGDYLRYRWNLKGEFKQIISSIHNKELKLFIKSMMKSNSNERASAIDLLNHEFITNISIDNLCFHQSVVDNSFINHDKLVNLIQIAINNKQIGESMKLKCDDKCEHIFCLSSVTATTFKKYEKIEKGVFGKVCKIAFKSEMGNENWVMKTIEIISNEDINNEVEVLENNINKYREKINHENIVKYYGAVRNFKTIFIFMEFFDGQSLHQKIKGTICNRLSLTEIKEYTKKILEGLIYLHNMKIFHSDIKSSNILINKNDAVKVTGFGQSEILRKMSKHEMRYFGTYNYMSPEMINGEPYDFPADIWSLGATVFEMATGHPPYHDLFPNAVIFKIATTRKIEYPSNISKDIRIFIDLMMNADPNKRLTADCLLNCSFLKER